MELKEYLIHSPGEYEYKHLDKPVYFSPEFLASLARKGKYAIEDGHNGHVIGTAIESVFKDGGLWIVTPDEFDTKEKGFSTSIMDYVLKDVGERYEAIDGRLGRIARTGDPKDITTILYNSKEPEDDDEHQGDDTGGNILSAENEQKILELNQTIGALKQEVNVIKAERDNLRDKITTLEGEKSDLETKIQEKDTTLTEKDTIITETKNAEKLKAKTIAEELAGDDETLLEVYKDMDVKKLRTLREKATKPVIDELAGEDEDLRKALSPLSIAQLNIIKEKGFAAHETGYNGVGDAGGDDQNNGGDGEGREDPPKSHEEWKAERGVY